MYTATAYALPTAHTAMALYMRDLTIRRNKIEDIEIN